ncbi:hypothetical protein LSUCC0246_03845 [Rhodobacterales bacterium LSUCC0246]|nr:hypothetical protein [Rhodobacterales bacterium LSUCC0374]
MTENETRLANMLPMAAREAKPRTRGLNYVRAPTILGRYLEDVFACYATDIDILKLSGHQITFSSRPVVVRAVAACREAGVRVAVGNPPLDVALSGGWACYTAFIAELAALGVEMIEVSCIGRAIDDQDFAKVIAAAQDKGLEVIVEVGVEFAHSGSEDGNLFLGRRIQQAQFAIEAGASMILVESEGLTENRKGQPYRWDAIDRIASAFRPEQLMFEADDQDVLSRYIEIFGPKANLMVDHTKIEKLEAARRGFGPSQSLWGKVVAI